MSEQMALDGVETGTRTERVEWGVRHPNERVQPCANRKHAEDIIEGQRTRWPDRRYPPGSLRIVRRTVVTYTTPWFWWQSEDER